MVKSARSYLGGDGLRRRPDVEFDSFEPVRLALRIGPNVLQHDLRLPVPLTGVDSNTSSSSDSGWVVYEAFVSGLIYLSDRDDIVFPINVCDRYDWNEPTRALYISTS